MALARIHTWSAGEVLLASELNAEFNNILNNAADLVSPFTKAISMGGFALYFDAASTHGITDSAKGLNLSACAINNAFTTVASDTTPDIWTTVSGLVNYTGTVTATGFAAAPQAGASRRLVCAGAAVFTAGANMLIQGVSSGSNLTAAAGDIIDVHAITTTQFRLIVLRADGTAVPVVVPSKGGTGIANNDASTVTISGNYAITVTVTGTTGITLPPTGTVATLTGNEALTNKTINGNTITAGSGTLTLAAGSTLATSGANSITFTSTGPTNVTSPTTGTLATLAGTETLTNKRVTARVGSTTSSATPTINTDNVDVYKLTAQAGAVTSFTTNLSGTPGEDDVLIIHITGTASRALTWGASFEASTIALPTTTVNTDMLTVGFLYNTVTSKWRCHMAV